ncbi:MAG: succinate dehydrogenase cytochrome b subunit [Acidimicrobiia bacterium]|nr:succinate dehydrogenase cytochrome b subunit [Acidimicrobiia bacterium]
MTATQPKPRTSRPGLLGIYRSDLGKKYAMAISGVFLLLFVFAHMVGNLHAFEGPEQINHYGEALRELGEPLLPRTMLLWVGLRIPLAIALAVHVHAAYALTLTNLRARSGSYDGRNYLAAGYASRTMRWTGVITLLFLAWHLADFTWGIKTVNPDYVRGDVYGNLIASLERWPVFALYLMAMGALGLHVWHGAWSLFQSLGINNPRFNAYRRIFAIVFATIVTGGFVTVPIAVQLGIIG